jgi:NAD(P)-dependent dehydrogenase (short-subunit alcohol dehydrogenase family)
MSDSLFSVAGQIVLVSGGSRGIGRAIAAGFAERGAKVVITGRRRETLEETARQINEQFGDGAAAAKVCDVADPNAITSLVDAVIAESGRIDTLVNVAGVNLRRPALQFTEEDYDYIVNVNQKGVFLLSQAVGKHMIQRRRGSQINVASLNTDRPLAYVAPYAASKAAVGHMTRSLAMEWGPSGVRVNALAPGFVLTDLTRQLWSDAPLAAWGKANTPLRRLGQPEDMVGTVIFLASEASAYMTGQILYVDGGFTAGWAWPIPSQSLYG